MEVVNSDRGFEFLLHPAYLPQNRKKVGDRLASQSSAVGDYDDSLDRPGSSFLWVGDNHHLNREEVAQLAKHLKSWLHTGSLED